jgi:hypothetical protein
MDLFLHQLNGSRWLLSREERLQARSQQNAISVRTPVQWFETLKEATDWFHALLSNGGGSRITIEHPDGRVWVVGH